MASAVISLIQVIFWIFNILLLARILASWFNPDPSSPIMRFLYNSTEPVLAPVRRLLPPTGTFDLSPLIVLVGAYILEAVLISLVRALL